MPIRTSEHDRLSWLQMLHAIRECFSEKEVKVEDLQNILLAYTSDESDWKKYVYFDAECRYTRNLVDNGNDMYNVMLLCWSPQAKTPIHDHSNSHCFYKVLKGCVKESIYNWPSFSYTTPKKSKESVYELNEVGYISDRIGLHAMSCSGDAAVSLHIYLPPIVKCALFPSSNTLQSEKVCKLKFYSEYGKIKSY